MNCTTKRTKFNCYRHSKCSRSFIATQEINVNSGNIIVNSGSPIEASAVATDAIKIEENNIHGTTQRIIELKSR